MRSCFRRKRSHEVNFLGAPGTVTILKANKYQTCSVKRAGSSVMLRIALNITTEVLNSCDFEPLELKFSTKINHISHDARHALNETHSVETWSGIYNSSLV
jgi:hypothetical protein